MAEKILAFYLEEEVHTLIKKLAVLDHKPLKQYLREIVEDHAKKRGDGNPAYTIDQFVETPALKAVPAFFRTREDWQEYIEKLPEKEAQDLLYQSQTISSLAEKKVKYGSSGVSVQSH